jgi:hypothetical protein
MADYAFIERAFQKMLLNFTWWVNREDPLGKNIFQGGFLGMDNIGAFDRDKLPCVTRVDRGPRGRNKGVTGDGVSYRLRLTLIPLQPYLAAAGADYRHRANRVHSRGNAYVSCLAGDP